MRHTDDKATEMKLTSECYEYLKGHHVQTNRCALSETNLHANLTFTYVLCVGSVLALSVWSLCILILLLIMVCVSALCTCLALVLVL